VEVHLARSRHPGHLVVHDSSSTRPLLTSNATDGLEATAFGHDDTVETNQGALHCHNAG
jgi:hypothetical protein